MTYAAAIDALNKNNYTLFETFIMHPNFDINQRQEVIENGVSVTRGIIHEVLKSQHPLPLYSLLKRGYVNFNLPISFRVPDSNEPPIHLTPIEYAFSLPLSGSWRNALILICNGGQFSPSKLNNFSHDQIRFLVCSLLDHELTSIFSKLTDKNTTLKSWEIPLPLFSPGEIRYHFLKASDTFIEAIKADFLTVLRDHFKDHHANSAPGPYRQPYPSIPPG